MTIVNEKWKVSEELEAYRQRRLGPNAVLRNQDERDRYLKLLADVNEACTQAAMLGKDSCAYHVEDTDPRIVHAVILALKEGRVGCSLEDLRSCNLGFLLHIRFFEQQDRESRVATIILGVLVLLVIATLYLIFNLTH